MSDPLSNPETKIKKNLRSKNDLFEKVTKASEANSSQVLSENNSSSSTITRNNSKNVSNSNNGSNYTTGCNNGCNGEVLINHKGNSSKKEVIQGEILTVKCKKEKKKNFCIKVKTLLGRELSVSVNKDTCTVDRLKWKIYLKTKIEPCLQNLVVQKDGRQLISGFLFEDNNYLENMVVVLSCKVKSGLLGQCDILYERDDYMDEEEYLSTLRELFLDTADCDDDYDDDEEDLEDNYSEENDVDGLTDLNEEEDYDDEEEEEEGDEEEKEFVEECCRAAQDTVNLFEKHEENRTFGSLILKKLFWKLRKSANIEYYPVNDFTRSILQLPSNSVEFLGPYRPCSTESIGSGEQVLLKRRALQRESESLPSQIVKLKLGKLEQPVLLQIQVKDIPDDSNAALNEGAYHTAKCLKQVSGSFLHDCAMSANRNGLEKDIKDIDSLSKKQFKKHYTIILEAVKQEEENILKDNDKTKEKIKYLQMVMSKRKRSRHENQQPQDVTQIV
ncbi:uncharacterized protein LOC135119513 isoform X2 [Zophobas morio]|uniref:uncharacterized protein LOC135119513 isoform X2 n=1 Tax=Zophobas morio TaxID=2755281 RepID=UPI003082B323